MPTTGIYKVIHAEHRLLHEVILSGGDIFPRCAKCSDVVIFELLREVRAKFEYQPIQVYELPEIDEEEKADSDHLHCSKSRERAVLCASS